MRSQLTFVKVGRARNPTGEGEHWRREDVNPTVNLFDIGDTRAVTLIISRHNSEQKGNQRNGTR